MKEFFNVADHVFSLEAEDSSEVWKHLDQYRPFHKKKHDGPVRFNLRLVSDMPVRLASDLPESSVIMPVRLASGIPHSERKLVYDVPTEDGQTCIRVYTHSDLWIYEFGYDSSHPVIAEMVSTGDYSRAEVHMLSKEFPDILFAVNNALMLMFAFSTALEGTLEMHASAVSHNGKAYLFLGKSGTGKSTHSQLWIKNIPGCELINDDNPVVRVLPDGSVFVYGTPWSGKTPCYRNVRYPIGAFVRLVQAHENKIVKSSILESYATVFSSSSGYRGDHRMADGLHATMEKIAINIPCFKLECRPDSEAALLCRSAVESMPYNLTDGKEK